MAFALSRKVGADVICGCSDALKLSTVSFVPPPCVYIELAGTPYYITYPGGILDEEGNLVAIGANHWEAGITAVAPGDIYSNGTCTTLFATTPDFGGSFDITLSGLTYTVNGYYDALEPLSQFFNGSGILGALISNTITGGSGHIVISNA